MSERMEFEIKEINSTTVGFAYRDFGSVIQRPARAIVIYNMANVDMYILIDSLSDDIRVPSEECVEIFPYNKHNDLNYSSFVAKGGTQLQIKLADNFSKGGIVVANIFT